MAKYRDNFNLSIQDIELIEAALRFQLNHTTPPCAPAPPGGRLPENVREIQRVLGKLHEQKIFFSQAGTRGSPGG